MISWLTRKFSRDPVQLGFLETLAAPMAAWRDATPPVRQPNALPARAGPRNARDPDTFLSVLQAHGLRGVRALVFTRNRRTMVSLGGGVLRVHAAFVDAPVPVLQAIAVFATTRTRARRNAARELIVSYPIPLRPPSRRPASQHDADLPVAARLTLMHAELNREHFAGSLASLQIQVSRRLARRLGHYAPRSVTGGDGEIVISLRHIRRDGWSEASHTLLHEMVHQWQDETGRPVDHGAGFRARCRSVGIAPAATRMIVRGSGSAAR